MPLWILIGSLVILFHISLPSAQLTSLSLVGEEHGGQWIVGLDVVPDAWRALVSLRKLELRGHQLLDTCVAPRPAPLGRMCIEPSHSTPSPCAALVGIRLRCPSRLVDRLTASQAARVVL